MILISPFIVPRGYLGITIYPFIFLKTKELKQNPELLNHEKIHVKQQLELLVLPFFIWYTIEFLFGYLKFWDWTKAYQNISFEKEAFQNEKNLDYLKSRPRWNFLNYI